MSDKQISEWDDSVTWSGLAAPSGWHIIDRAEDGLLWQRLHGEAIKVMESTSVKPDGRTWLHVSVSKPSKSKMPTYEDIQTMRRLFIGENRESYMIFPTQDRYININPVLHLFACLDQPEGVLPRMEGETNVPEEAEVAGVPVIAYRRQRSV